jgi:dTDP-4-dehydrorhamnose reductase
MIWITGATGMLGNELSRLFKNCGIAHTGTGSEVDITNKAALFSFAAGKSITWIINCAAYTAVDKAEDDAAACRRINTDGTAYLAEVARSIDAKLVHISTDYVFNGNGALPYREDDPTDPTGVYGLSKRDGEARLLAEYGAAFIIRTAWLYGEYGKNFVATMLRLMKERNSISVVSDQRGSPTWTFDLAHTIITLIEKHDRIPVPYGIYHFTGEGTCTWFEFARAIYAKGRGLGLLTKECTVNPCTSAEYPAKVKRPLYSVLDKTKITGALDITIPSWEASLENFLWKAGTRL